MTRTLIAILVVGFFSASAFAGDDYRSKKHNFRKHSVRIISPHTLHLNRTICHNTEQRTMTLHPRTEHRSITFDRKENRCGVTKSVTLRGHRGSVHIKRYRARQTNFFGESRHPTFRRIHRTHGSYRPLHRRSFR